MKNGNVVIIQSKRSFFYRNLFKFVTLTLLCVNLYLLLTDQYSLHDLENDKSAFLSEDLTFNQKAAYAVGASFGRDFSSLKKDQESYIGVLDNDFILSGFKDSLFNSLKLSDREISQILISFDQKISQKMNSELSKVADKNKNSEENFLLKNKENKDVYVTTSGLQYRIIHQGSSDKAVKENTKSVNISYTGKVLSGAIFDKQEKGVELKMSQLISGLQEALKLMKQGDEYEIFVPSDLAYRDNAVGNIIEPYSMLIFRVKLNGIY